jgi:diguanylate cyclase (GGDEF)-like protein
MRPPERQDLLLLGGLTLALIIVFSAPISRLLDFARDVERQTGLTLIPALILLTVVYLFHDLRKRQEAQARAAAAETARLQAEQRAEELERLVAFGQSLSRSLDFDAIRSAAAHHLPRVAGTPNVSVFVREGSKWEALAGEARSGEGAMPWGDLAEQLLAGGAEDDGTARTIGFPLMVGGSALGVLGVRPLETDLAPDRRRVIEAAAALLAVSVKNAQLFREVRENSVRDPLTACFTRAHALEIIDAELRRARRSQSPVSMIMFDLDRFKDVNDRYGHLCGDAALSAIGKRMREVLRGSDLKCRYGGEEFLVLLPETPLHGARRVAETLRREIAERPIPWSGEALTVTASFGLAQALPGEVNVQGLISRADQALYRAKDDGRNCVRIASDSMATLGDNEGRRNVAG